MHSQECIYDFLYDFSFLTTISKLSNTHLCVYPNIRKFSFFISQFFDLFQIKYTKLISIII